MRGRDVDSGQVRCDCVVPCRYSGKTSMLVRTDVAWVGPLNSVRDLGGTSKVLSRRVVRVKTDFGITELD